MMQLNMETSIQARDIEDIMVTTTPDLVFALVIFLNMPLIILFIVHLDSSYVHLNTVLDFS